MRSGNFFQQSMRTWKYLAEIIWSHIFCDWVINLFYASKSLNINNLYMCFNSPLFPLSCFIFLFLCFCVFGCSALVCFHLATLFQSAFFSRLPAFCGLNVFQARFACRCGFMTPFSQIDFCSAGCKFAAPAAAAPEGLKMTHGISLNIWILFYFRLVNWRRDDFSNAACWEC